MLNINNRLGTSPSNSAMGKMKVQLVFPMIMNCHHDIFHPGCALGESMKILLQMKLAELAAEADHPNGRRRNWQPGVCMVIENRTS